MHRDTQAPVSNQVPRRPAAAESSYRPTRRAARNAAAIVGLWFAAAGTTAACSGDAPVGDPAESVGTTSEALMMCSPATLYTTGDFNGDGKQDLILTNPSGSYWYLSNGDGTWRQTYVRTDLTTYNTQYVVGDFNGDHVDDVLIYVNMTSYLYVSNGDGTFTGNVWVGAVKPMAVGDFNGDGKMDLIATGVGNPNESQIYISDFVGTSGSWDTSWGQAPGTTVADSNFAFAVGNFDGASNRFADLVVISDSGSTVYYSSGSGAWTAGLTRPDLQFGSAFFTAADFNGDGNDDLIISNSSGSYWYFSNGTNHNFTSNVYVRGDLPIDGYSAGGAPGALLNSPTYPTYYQTVDLDADGRKDLLIQDVAGTYAYLSGYTGTSGSWTQAWSLGPAEYVIAGDFNHDHASDILVEDSTGTNGFFSSIPGLEICTPECPPAFPKYTANPATGKPVWSRGDLAANNMFGVGYPVPYWGEGAAPLPGGLRQPTCFSEWEGPCLNQGCNAGLQCEIPGGSYVGAPKICQPICQGLIGDCCQPDGTCTGVGLACQSGVCEPSCSGGGALGEPCCAGGTCAVGNTCVSLTNTCETKVCGTAGARCCTSEGTPECGSGLQCEPGNPSVCNACGAQGEVCCASGCNAGLACNSTNQCEVPSTCVGFAGGGTEGNPCCPGNECQAGLSCHVGCVGFATPICTAGCTDGLPVGGGGGTCNVAGDPCCSSNGIPVCGTQSDGTILFCCNGFCETSVVCP